MKLKRGRRMQLAQKIQVLISSSWAAQCDASNGAPEIFISLAVMIVSAATRTQPRNEDEPDKLKRGLSHANFLLFPPSPLLYSLMQTFFFPPLRLYSRSLLVSL